MDVAPKITGISCDEKGAVNSIPQALITQKIRVHGSVAFPKGDHNKPSERSEATRFAQSSL